MTDRELMQQALDLLDDINQCSLPPTGIPLPAEIDHVMEALRARLAQPEQEPVAQVDYNERGNICWLFGKQVPDKTFLYTAPPQQPERKLWLWKNFVDGRPEYWAFDNPYPTNLDNGDPQTLGQPCGYAIFKPSRDGSCGRTEKQVLREMKNAKTPQREWQTLTDEDIEKIHYDIKCKGMGAYSTNDIYRAVEAKLKDKNEY